MNDKYEISKDFALSLVDIDGPSELLANALLQGKLIRYADNRFQVSSGEYRFIFKLIQEEDKVLLFYAQVPYIYPIPDEMKTSIKESLELALKTPVNIEFINAINAQNHAQFKQQLDQKLSTLSRPTIPSLSQVQSLSQTPPPAAVVEELKATQGPAQTYQKQQGLNQGSSNASQSNGYSMPQPTPTVAPPPAKTTAPTQQPYTGFMNQPSTSNTAAPAQKNSGGGFNIKY